MIPKRAEDNPSLITAYFALFMGIIFLSLSPMFVRWADGPGIVTSFYRMLTASVIMGIIHLLGKNPKPEGSVLPKISSIWLLPVLAGVASGIDHAFWSIAVENTLVTNVTLLNYIAPLWVALFAILVLREKYARSFWLALAAILLGNVIFFSSQMDFSSQFSLTGEGFAFISSFFFASYLVISQYAQKDFKVTSFLLISSFSAMIVLLVIILWMGLSLFGYSTQTYLIFLFAGLLSQLGGYYSINYALRKLPATIVSSTFLLQPVLTVILAAVFEGEGINIHQILGGIFIIGGIYFIKVTKK